MKIKILFAQRKCSYGGEYAPEALAVVDQHTDDENPEYFQRECEKELKVMGNECEAHRVIEIEVSDDDIQKALLSVVSAQSRIVE
jgi:hypothetical protein